MADTILRVAGRDYSRYLKLYTEDQVGVVDAERIAPQFAGVAALSEGAVWIADAVQNKHWQVQTIIAGKTDVGLYPGDAWATSQAFWLLAGATYTASTGQVTTPGVGASEGVAISLGTLPAGTYTFRLLLRGNAGGEVVRLSGGLVDGTGGNSASLTLTTAEQPYTMTFTTDGSGTCYAVVRTVGTLAATWFIGQGVAREQAISVDRANQLVAQIQKELVKGAVVEYRPDGASLSTFFDLESGEFRPDYNHPRYRKGYVEGMLELFTRPYGNTGTTRLIASVAATAITQLPATGILGDTAAVGQIAVAVPSPIPDFIVWGISRSASYQPLIPVASFIAKSVGTVIGASGAVASQFYAPDSPITSDVYVPMPNGHSRVFALARSHYPSGALALTTRRGDAISYGGTTPVPRPASGPWQVVDLGDVAFDAQPSGMTATVYLNIRTFVASGASVIATQPAQIAGVFVLPLDVSAGVAAGLDAIDTTGRAVRFESYPRARTYIGPATDALVIHYGADAYGRGGGPRFPPCGSPAASGPLTIAVLTGSRADYNAGKTFGVQVSVREQWSFFR